MNRNDKKYTLKIKHLMKKLYDPVYRIDVDFIKNSIK